MEACAHQTGPTVGIRQCHCEQATPFSRLDLTYLEAAFQSHSNSSKEKEYIVSVEAKFNWFSRQLYLNAIAHLVVQPSSLSNWFH